MRHLRLSEKTLLIVLLILFLIFCVWMVMSWPHKVSSTPTARTPAETIPNGHTGVGEGPGMYWHHDYVLLPNPKVSPGEVRTTDFEQICNEHTKDFRDTSGSLKNHIYEEYRTMAHQGVCIDTQRMTKGSRKHPPHEVTEACEIDHIISLELGGADTGANLFPQPYNPPNAPGAHAKDRVENYLHDQVCKHGLPVATAQNLIKNDWYQVYLDAHLDERRY